MVRRNLTPDDKDIYKIPVTGGAENTTPTPIVDADGDPVNLVKPQRPDRSETSTSGKKTWLDTSSMMSAAKPEAPKTQPTSKKDNPANQSRPDSTFETEKEQASKGKPDDPSHKDKKKKAANKPTVLPPTQEEMWAKAEEKKAEKSQNENEGDLGDASGNDEEQVVSLEEYQALQKRVEILTQDYEALKNRQKITLEENKLNANMNLAKVLLPIFDDLDKALEYSRQTNTGVVDADGMEKIRKKMIAALEAEGLEVVNPINQPFDMNEHQAIDREKTDGPADMVIKVFQPGYKMNGRVIRPALVVVSY